MSLLFNHHKYLNGTLTEENCSHQILYGDAVDEGMYGEKYTCAICGKEIINPNNNYIDDRYIIYQIGSLTPHYNYVVPFLLRKISNVYINRQNIDIVTLFRLLEPEIKKYLADTNPFTSFQKRLLKKIK